MFLLFAVGIIYYIFLELRREKKGVWKISYLCPYEPGNLNPLWFVVFVGADEFSFGACTHTHTHI